MTSGAPLTASGLEGDQASSGIEVAGVAFVGDPLGALYWPEQGLLAVADLHLEKGSSYAARGVLLPPYDTAATLARLARLIARYAPRLVVALGDSFHDNEGPARVAAGDLATLRSLQRGRDWIWIAGNHDPRPGPGIGGSFAATLACDPIVFRHEPQTCACSGKVDTGFPIRTCANAKEAERVPIHSIGTRSCACDGEIAGHLHPRARVSQRGRTTSRRCFAGDGRRLVMPAFGAYTGGLNVRDRAFADVFGTLAFTAHMLGEARLYAIAAARCLAD